MRKYTIHFIYIFLSLLSFSSCSKYQEIKTIKLHLTIDYWGGRNCHKLRTSIIEAKEGDKFIKNNYNRDVDSLCFEVFKIINDSTVALKKHKYFSTQYGEPVKFYNNDSNIVIIGLSGVMIHDNSFDAGTAYYFRVEESPDKYQLPAVYSFPSIRDVTYIDRPLEQRVQRINYFNDSLSYQVYTEIYDTNSCLVRDGLMERWHINGQLLFRLNFDNGQANGLYETWYENGKRKELGYLLKNNKEGNWSEWYEKGNLKEEGTYIAGIKDGYWTYYYTNGHKSSEGIHFENKKGEWKYYYENGEFKEIGSYENGLKNGDWVYYDSTGKKEAYGMFSRGTGKTYYINNQLRSSESYQNGKKAGIWRSWYKDGILKSEVIYKQGSPTGMAQNWFENGNLKKMRLYIQTGNDTCKEYYENGQIKSLYFCYNKNAPLKTWYEDGTLRSIREFISFSRYSLAAEYYTDGKKKNERRYNFQDSLFEISSWHANGQLAGYGKEKDGKNIGIWKFWDRNGTLIKTENY